jgi:hypothetical protein
MPYAGGSIAPSSGGPSPASPDDSAYAAQTPPGGAAPPAGILGIPWMWIGLGGAGLVGAYLLLRKKSA